MCNHFKLIQMCLDHILKSFLSQLTLNRLWNYVIHKCTKVLDWVGSQIAMGRRFGGKGWVYPHYGSSVGSILLLKKIIKKLCVVMGYLTKIYKVELKCETCHILGWRKGWNILLKNTHAWRILWGCITNGPLNQF